MPSLQTPFFDGQDMHMSPLNCTINAPQNTFYTQGMMMIGHVKTCLGMSSDKITLLSNHFLPPSLDGEAEVHRVASLDRSHILQGLGLLLS